MKPLLSFLAISSLFLSAISCSNSDDDPAPAPTPIIVTFNATLNGTSEVPTNTSTATGTATMSYNKTSKILTLNVTYSGITPNDGHIHVGAVGVDGPVVFHLPSLTSPISFTSTALTTAQENDLLANNYYVNLHTEAFPGGEIRGQLITTNPGGSGGGGGGGGGY
jgi:hypothetical protein